jgi:hypothetical protein
MGEMEVSLSLRGSMGGRPERERSMGCRPERGRGHIGGLEEGSVAWEEA